MPFTCYRCPSSATHFPRIMFRSRPLPDRGSNNTRIKLELPVCFEHRTPFPETILRDAATSILSGIHREMIDKFVEAHGVMPDPLLTTIDYVAMDHPDVVLWQQELADRRALLPASVRHFPILIEHVTFEELAEIMSKAPDIAVPFPS
jgi:hypothetical protein